MCLNGSTEYNSDIPMNTQSHAGHWMLHNYQTSTRNFPQSALKITPGKMGGTGTDGEGTLEHRVMKQSTENSVIYSALQMNLVGVMCLLFW